jgi:hypothetical protein
MGGNQDAVAFLVNIDDGAVETFVFGKARGHGKAHNEEVTRVDDEKNHTHR